MVKVFKIGGNVVDNSEKLNSFLVDFANIKGAKILVHGGGKIATHISKKLDIPTNMIHGRRVTDRDTLDVVTMVYAGLINKNIVSKLGVKAIGLSGADMGLIISKRRPIKDGVDYGFVGDPYLVNNDALKMLIDSNYTPIIAPITVSDSGELLNTNADTVAQSIAVSLSTVFPVELIYCFEHDGVMGDIEDKDSLIKSISKDSFEELKQSGVVSDGMIPKIENAIKAVEQGVSNVYICNSSNIGLLAYGGTKISL